MTKPNAHYDEDAPEHGTLNTDALQRDLDTAAGIIDDLRQETALQRTEIAQYKLAALDYIELSLTRTQTLLDLQNEFRSLMERTNEIVISKDTEIAQLKEYIVSLEILVRGRDELAAVLPECPEHGKGCIHYAVDWINRSRELWEYSGDDPER